MQDDQFRKSLTDGKSGVLDLGSHVKETGKNVTELGTKVTAFTAPLVLGIGLAVGASNNFSEAMTNTAAVLGLTRDETKGLSAEILAIGSTSRAGPQSVAEAYYDVVGGVSDANSHIAILNASIATAEAGNAALAGTTSALISVMNGYSFSADKATYASDVMTQIVGKGVGSMEELAGALPSVSGLAASMGIEFDDLGAAMALVTTKGNSFSEAGTQLRAMMTALLNPNEKMKKGLAELGFESGQAAVDALGLTGAYKALMGTQTASTGGFAAMTGSVEALNGAIALTGDGSEEFLNNFTDGLDGATEAAREIQNSSPAAMFDLLNSKVSALVITIGDAFIPILTQIVDFISPIVDSVLEWIQANPEAAGTIAMITTALVALGPVLMVVGGAITGLGTVIGLLTSPITLVIAAVAALGLAYHENFLGIRDFVDNEVRPRLEQFFNFLGGVWAIVQPALQSLYDWFVVTALPAIKDFVETTVLPAVEGFFNFISGVWDLVSSPLNALHNWFTVEGLPQIRDFIVTQVLPKINEFITTLQNIWTSVQPFLNDLRTNFENVFNGIKQVIQPVLDMIGGIGKAVQDAIKWIQQLDEAPKVGIDKVDPSTGVTDPNALFAGPGYSSGGWTGNGAPNQPAGIVHGQEWVVPMQGALVLRESGGESGGMKFEAGAVVINANTYEEGQAAGRGFMDYLEQTKRRRG